MRVMRTVADDSTYRILEIRPLTGALGAELTGVDLSQPLTEEACAEIKRALYSQAILQFLYNHASRMEYTCRVRWRPGMVLVWDNRCTYHSAIGDYDALRYMERVTTGGEVPV